MILFVVRAFAFSCHSFRTAAPDPHALTPPLWAYSDRDEANLAVRGDSGRESEKARK
jgi:hypothetical protein